MAIRRLPDLTPEQVVNLQDALLANADALLSSALALLDLGNLAPAQSLAILGLEESGKAIAIHERRVMMSYIADGETFRCEWLDELWANHQKKLEIVHQFLVDEPYWFGVEPSDREDNVSYLGTIKSWSRRHDRSKQRGFYVDIGKTGEVMAPSDITDETTLREVITRVHQIGWQLRLGEHIEGKQQDQLEEGIPALKGEELALADNHDFGATSQIEAELRRTSEVGIAGESLPNAGYRFNPPESDRSPFRNLGKPGYEAETRELIRFARDLDQRD